MVNTRMTATFLASLLSISLIGMDEKSVTCQYKLRIFHFLVPSGQLPII